MLETCGPKKYKYKVVGEGEGWGSGVPAEQYFFGMCLDSDLESIKVPAYTKKTAQKGGGDEFLSHRTLRWPEIFSIVFYAVFRIRIQEGKNDP